MKKINYPLRTALMLLMILFAATSVTATDFHDHLNNLYCNFLDDGTVSITYDDQSDNYNSYSGYVTIPDQAALGVINTQYRDITEIGEYAFRNCYDLTGITIGSNVKKLGFDAFWNCTELTELDVPNNVTSIANWCFENCSAMTKITLGSGLTSIGGSAFSGCTSLSRITCNATTPPTITSSTFPSTITNSASLYVPTPGAVVAYKADIYWSSFKYIYALRYYDFVSGGIYYAITGSNTVKVTNNNGNYNTYSGSVTIPATVTYGGKTYKVTAIDDNAFRNCSNLTSVTIGSNVTTIGEWAFSYSGLTSVVIPDNVQSIGYNAFGDISSLETVTIGQGVTYIGTYGFDSPLTDITVKATTPPTIASENAFKSTTYSDAEIFVPKGRGSAYMAATYWSKFQNMEENYYDFYVGGFYYIKTGTSTASVCRKVSTLPCVDYTGTMTIPATVTYNGTTYKVTGIDVDAFCLTTVTKVTIGSNVTTIGANAFLICSLTSIVIPNTVTSIGQSAFEGCSKLKTASIGTGITSISDNAFASTALTAISIPNNVKTIGKEAFYHCDDATSLSIGTGVTSIGEGAFGSNNSWTTITIPDNVKTIGSGAFLYCTRLKTLNLGSGLTSIGDEAFKECNALTSIKCDALTPPTIKSATFSSSTYSSATLTVPNPTAVTAYKAANYWKNFTNIVAAHEYDFAVSGIYYKITGTNTVSVTFKDAAYNSYTSSTVTIPATVTYNGTSYKVTAIGDNAFRKSTAVTKVTIGSNVTTIGQFAFYASGLTTVTIPNGVTEIKTYAFGNCTSLASVTIGSGVTTIGAYAFSGCTALTAITSNATTPPAIQSSTFASSTYTSAMLTVPNPTAVTAYKAANYWKNFSNIKAAVNYDFAVGGVYYQITGTNTVSVTFKDAAYNSYTAATVAIPGSVSYGGTTYKVTAIGDNAFRKSTAVTKVTIGSNVTTIGQFAFYASGLTTVTIPNGVTEIKTYAFGNCTSLASVIIGTGVTTIGGYAFSGCTALTAITSNATTPPAIQSSTFASSTYTSATLTVPNPTAVTAYKAANYWKNFTSIKAATSYDFYQGGVYYLITGTNTVSVTHKDANYNSYTAATVTIPATVSYSGTSYRVTAIGDNAFRKSTAVTKVNIGSNVTSIGQYAFYGSGLTAVTIPDQVTSIKTNAFGSCNSLASVTIGKGVTAIAALAFDSPITSVTCNAATPPTMANTNAFRTATYDNATLYVPTASLAAYKAASGWRYFAKIQGVGGALPGDVTGDGELDIADVTMIIEAVLKNQYIDPAVADVNGDGEVDIADVTQLITTALGL